MPWTARRLLAAHTMCGCKTWKDYKEHHSTHVLLSSIWTDIHTHTHTVWQDSAHPPHQLIRRAEVRVTDQESEGLGETHPTHIDRHSLRALPRNAN